MSYNFTKKTCDRCGVNEKNGQYVTETYAYGRTGKSNSFRLALDGGVLCAPCHQEKQLTDLFNKMGKEGA